MEGDKVDKMSPEELKEGLAFVDKHFYFIRYVCSMGLS
jgi:hypothetical protein